MKTKLILLSALLSLAFVSCNKKEEIQKTESIKDNFSVVIEGIFTKNDKFQIFYLPKGGQWSDENSVIRPIYGSNEMQNIEVDLPKEVTPENLRVDFGSNPTQNLITIKNITVKYKSKEINGDLDNFNRYFFPNDFMKWDPDHFGHKLIKIGTAYDPYMMGKDILTAKLKKLKE